MLNLFENISEKLKLFFFIFLLYILSFLLVLFLKGTLEAAMFGLLMITVLYIARFIWLSDNYGRNRVRTLSLTIALSAITTQSTYHPFIQETIIDKAPYFILATYYPWLNFLFLTIIIIGVNYLMRDKTNYSFSSDPIDELIPELSFHDTLKNIIDSLSEDLRSIDIRTNWSTKYFTPLDAEVEVKTTKGKQKRITDLLKAINKSRDELLLVLGDPGAGKSVSLRKLCQDLSSECLKNRTIPIYINLREWVIEEKWDEKNPPSVEQLYNFILENIKSRDILLSKFFHRYYDKLYQRGRLYFVFDSFDEIPAVLDENENSALIHQLSEVIYKFLKGATRSGKTKGILSSRFFRRPTKEFHTNTILEIRPFNEHKILQTLRRSRHISEHIIYKLFKERPELEAVAKNPFSATLISEYVENNRDKLPQNQYEMYSDYIRKTLESCSERIKKNNLSIDIIIRCAIRIASEMFDKYGLEAPINKLVKSSMNLPIDRAIDILKFARLGRVGTGDQNQFSFSHRRFAEYFVIQNVLENGLKIDIESIPADSQWRDALVLYCEVADEKRASSIAKYCWEIVSVTNNPMNLRVIHSIRFLRDAFKGRLTCINSFRKELGEYIKNQFNEDNNIIATKLAVETVGLLQEDDIDQCIYSAMNLNNKWISHAAFQSCRNLSNISSQLEMKIFQFILRLPVISFLKEYKQLTFSLSLSEAFKKVLKVCQLIYFHIIISIIAFLLVFLLTPHFIIAGLCFLFFTIILFSLLDFISGYKTEIKEYFYLGFIPWLFLAYWFLGGMIAIALGSEIELQGSLTDSPLLVFVGFFGSFNFFRSILDYIGLPLFNIFLTFLLVINLPFYRIVLIDWEHLIELIKNFNLNQYLLKLKRFIQRNVRRISIGVGIIIFHIVIGAKVIAEQLWSNEWISDLLLLYGLLWLIGGAYSIVKVVLTGLIKILNKISNIKYFFNETKNINFAKLNEREYIYETIKGIRFEYNRNKIIDYLENEIKEVKGEWPNKDLFLINSPFLSTRLAKLEERWLGLDR